ncbi:MAG: biopolymer transporter ExbD [Deltaproteobacteria bacterium]|nr:biopolymer transporter ExbD [Deltaproteobacteria bacterium]
MAARLLSDGGDDEAIVAEINVTPLTDIFLVLLIIFMVTSTAMMQQGSKVSLPSSQSGSPETTGLTITATADHTIELNGVTIERARLRDELAKALAAREDKGVILRGDRTIILEDAVQLMAIAREAGADRLAIATAPPGK